MKKTAVWISIVTIALFYQVIMSVGSINKVEAAETSGELDYTCAADTPLGPVNIDMGVTPTMTIPDTVGPNEEIAITDINSAVEIDLMGDLDDLRGLIQPFSGSVENFNFEANDESFNIVGDEGSEIGPIEHSEEDSNIAFEVAGNDTTFTAGEAGENVEITAGAIDTVISAAGGAVSLDVICTPPEDNVIATVSVEEADTEAPVIELNGDNPMELEVGEEYDEPGASADDDVDGDLSDDIEVTGEVDTSTAGEYEIVYTVSDAAGNEAEETRTVNVVEPSDSSGSLAYTCEADTPLGDLTIGMKVTPSMSAPDTVEPNEEIEITDINSAVEIDLMGDLDDKRDLIQPFSGSVENFKFEANGESFNIVGDEGSEIGPIEHSEEDSNIAFEAAGNDTTFTAGEAGENVEITAGEIKAEILALDGAIPLEAHCAPPEDNVIATVSVEEADTEAPVIELNGESSMELEVGEEYEEPGATAEDDVDGDVTGNIEITGEVDTSTAGEYEIVYTVSDAAGNEAEETRTVYVVEADEEEPEDEIAPVITLDGDNPMELEVGEEYEEPGATAEDDVDGEVTDNIEITGDVDTSTVGEYEIVYTVSDAAGNEAEETRTVNVVEPDEEEPGDGDEKEVDSGEKTDVNANETVKLKDSGATIKLPEDLPEDTKIKVVDEKENENLENMNVAGDVVDVTMLFATEEDENREDLEYVLTLAIDEDKLNGKEAGIFYYNEDKEKWELVENSENNGNGTISATVNHFSMYGVFSIDPTDTDEEKIEELEKVIKNLEDNVGALEGQVNDLEEALKDAEGALEKALEEALAKVEEALEEARNAQEAAEAGQKEAEEALEAAEQAQKKAEKALAEAEQAKKEAEEALALAKKASANGDNENGNNDEENESSVTTTSNNNDGGNGTLPSTATSNPLFIALGAGLLLAGVATMAIRRKKQFN